MGAGVGVGVGVDVGGFKGVLVDNTNLKAPTRLEWVRLARALGVPIRCIVLDVPKHVAMLLSKLRMCSPLSSETDRRRSIPDMVMHSHFKDAGASPPCASAEGFARVDVAPWSLRPPRDEAERFLYGCYLK